MLRVIVFALVLNGGFCEPLSFKGHKVVRIVPQTTREVRFLQTILKNKTEIDVWKPPSAVNVPVDLSLSPLNYDNVIQDLRNGGLRPSLLIDDVQDMADNQVASRQQPSFKLMTILGEFDYSSYHTFDEILVWMENITRVHSDKAELFMVTDSYEGRPLMGIKINSEPEVEKPGFYFEGGIHAREWISSATMIYMTAQMLDKYGIDPDISAMVDKFEWYIVPVANPDGYAYTWTDNRFWRKTRSLNNGSSCIGTDPNRNWNFAWCEPGATSNPCSDNYCGSAPFSEVEIRGISDFIKGKTNMKAFIDFHSYSQLWMSPWAFTDAELPPDVILQNEGSVVAVEALQKVHGTEFENGPIGTILYVASGSSIDWAYGVAEIIFSYGVELRDKGQFGFLLPSDQIVPSGEETLQALRALANYVYSQ